MRLATHEDFEPLVGSAFAFETSSGPVDLMLDNIVMHSELYMRDSTVEIEGFVIPPRRGFALTFVGPHDPMLQSLTYSVTHPETGRIDLFLSAFRQDQDATLYESILN
ncbi:MAG: hypothetical protein WBF53_06070 [Litorimonas sp.]